MIAMGDRFGTTWWGRLWIHALEELGDDFENRLPRGKKYAEEGAVSHFMVKPGEIQARVHGRKTYEVTLGLPALTPLQWDRALERIAQESRFTASLLAGEMPQGLDETFREAGASLYPRVPKELQTHCTCPDWANPCKHVAAVCYIMAEALDRDPWLLFDLRGKTRESVLEVLQEMGGISAASAPAAPRRRRLRKGDAVVDLVSPPPVPSDPWRAMDAALFDRLGSPLPEIQLPRSIPADPSVFVQLGPLPHARIETSLGLAALLHRSAELVKLQIEQGMGNMDEGDGSEDAPSPSAGTPRPWRSHHHRRRWNKQR